MVGTIFISMNAMSDARAEDYLPRRDTDSRTAMDLPPVTAAKMDMEAKKEKKKENKKEQQKKVELELRQGWMHMRAKEDPPLAALGSFKTFRFHLLKE